MVCFVIAFVFLHVLLEKMTQWGDIWKGTMGVLVNTKSVSTFLLFSSTGWLRSLGSPWDSKGHHRRKTVGFRCGYEIWFLLSAYGETSTVGLHLQIFCLCTCLFFPTLQVHGKKDRFTCGFVRQTFLVCAAMQNTPSNIVNYRSWALWSQRASAPNRLITFVYYACFKNSAAVVSKVRMGTCCAKSVTNAKLRLIWKVSPMTFDA